MDSLREWLQSVGLEQHSEKLHENGIDVDIVASAKLEQADASVDSKMPSRMNAGERRQLTQFTHAFESNESGMSLLFHTDDLILKDIDLV